jgi:error-prone DNA polymerase
MICRGRVGLYWDFTIRFRVATRLPDWPKLLQEKMYIELHARSAFSFLEGSSIPEEMVEACAERGMGAMAVLDRDGVYGAPRFYHAAVKKGIRAHIGAEITTPEGWRFPLLVESRAGYQNLCRAITLMKLRDKKGEGSLAREELAAYAKGLVCLTGGDEGPLAHALSNGGIKRATQTVERLCGIFGHGNVFVELQRHYCREEEARNQAAIEIARKLSLPLLATNCASYAQPQQRELLDVFTCIRHHRNLSNAGRLLTLNAERHLKTSEEMARIFADLPEAIANTESRFVAIGIFAQRSWL